MLNTKGEAIEYRAFAATAAGGWKIPACFNQSHQYVKSSWSTSGANHPSDRDVELVGLIEDVVAEPVSLENHNAQQLKYLLDGERRNFV